MKVDKTFHLRSTSVKRLDRLSAKTGTGRSQLLERGINLLTAIESGTVRVVKVSAIVLPLEAALQESAAVDAMAGEVEGPPNQRSGDLARS